MSFRKQLQSLGILSTLLGTSLLVYPPSSQAIPEFLVSVDFPQSAPSGGGTLSRTYGGGSRTGATSCLEEGDNVEPLTALIPEDTLVKTADSEPTLYVYVPKTVSSEEISATVVILTPGQPRQLPEEVYVGKTLLPDALNEGGGIVRYKLEGADLKAGETYTWSFSIHCDPTKYDLDRYVRGVFERTEDLEPLPANLDNMNATSLIAKANEYAAGAIWNETVNLAAKLRSLDTGEWAGLLKSVNLPQFESIPFVSCQNSEYCVPEPEDLEF